MNILYLKIKLPTKIVQLLEDKDYSLFYGTTVLTYKDFDIEVGAYKISWIYNLGDKVFLTEYRTLEDVDELIKDFTNYLKEMRLQ